jgi:hypothetical protein
LSGEVMRISRQSANRLDWKGERVPGCSRMCSPDAMVKRLAILIPATAVAVTAFGLAALVVTARQLDGAAPSSADLNGFGLILFISTILIAAFFYAPTAAWLVRRRRSAVTTALVCALAANIPVFLALAWGIRNQMFGGWSEAALFAAAYVVAGAAFGAAYTRLAVSRSAA